MFPARSRRGYSPIGAKWKGQGEQDPEHPVGAPQAWTPRGALEDCQLVAQREVLEHQGAAGPEHAEEAGEDEGDHGGHHPSGQPEVQC
jgi:hypothetical protein